jgi:uncharacterized protein YndB with AHSA1/START domain
VIHGSASIDSRIPDSFRETVIIQAPPRAVWEYLTDPECMHEWLGDSAMSIEVETTWQVGSPIVIRGVHHKRFENIGTVLSFTPPKELSYTHLSSLSRLPKTPDSYTTLAFTLEPAQNHTTLTVVASHFPTMAIYRHLEFYWAGTLSVIKRGVESA